MNMMTVYVVQTDNYGSADDEFGITIRGVFSTYEKARQVACQYESEDYVAIYPVEMDAAVALETTFEI